MAMDLIEASGASPGTAGQKATPLSVGSRLQFNLRPGVSVMLLLIDNYDSFTWNLVQRFGEIAPDLAVEVHRNDHITTDEISAKAPTVGAAADRKRLDLTLGVDTDLDGLPDAWERSLLQRLGLPLTDLGRITPDGVLEADGLTNFQKYISGTYSGDTAQSFYLKIKDVTDTDVGVEFYTLTNKVYSIEKSGDLATWTSVNFTVGLGSAVSVYTATGAEIVGARIPWVSGEEKAFYRLKVR